VSCYYDDQTYLDKAGRVMIPKPLRQEWHLGPGDTLELERDGDQIILRPMRPKALLKNSITAAIDRQREKRLRELMG
jgi:AbrB family looped-hinge helix DNA binding protein